MIRLTALAARWSARLGGGVILAAALLVAAEVVSRNLGLGLRLHAFELTNFAFAASVAFGFSWALVERAHIRIDIAYRLFPLPVRALLDVLALASLTVTGSVMAWHGWRVVAASVTLGARPNSTLDIPMAAPQALWAAGLTWFALTATLLTLAALADLVRGRWDRVQAQAGVATAGDAR